MVLLFQEFIMESNEYNYCISDNLDFSNGNYHQSSDNFKKANKFLDFNEFQSLTHKDTFIYLIPHQLLEIMFSKITKIYQSRII